MNGRPFEVTCTEFSQKNEVMSTTKISFDRFMAEFQQFMASYKPV